MPSQSVGMLGVMPGAMPKRNAAMPNRTPALHAGAFGLGMAPYALLKSSGTRLRRDPLHADWGVRMHLFAHLRNRDSLIEIDILDDIEELYTLFHRALESLSAGD
ncbi:MAG: hypothetical protein JSU63_04260 [Phycisphaerales bacterium]|nr:MAG: hypothetical protein JSU63_04260 [Phycisphaerales bacterium]